MTAHELIEQRLDAAHVSEPELRTELADHIWSAAEARTAFGVPPEAAVAEALVAWPVAQLERIRAAWYLAKRQAAVQRRIPQAVGAGVVLYLLEVLLPGNIGYNGFLGGLSVGLVAAGLLLVGQYQRLQVAQGQLLGEPATGFSPQPTHVAAVVLGLAAMVMLLAPVVPSVAEEYVAMPLFTILALAGLWVRPIQYRWRWPEWMLLGAAMVFAAGLAVPGRTVSMVAMLLGASAMAWNWAQMWRERALSNTVQAGKTLLLGGLVLMASLPTIGVWQGKHLNVFLPLAVTMVIGIGLLGIRFRQAWADLHTHFHHYYRGLLLPWAMWMILILLSRMTAWFG